MATRTEIGWVDGAETHEQTIERIIDYGWMPYDAEERANEYGDNPAKQVELTITCKDAVKEKSNARD